MINGRFINMILGNIFEIPGMHRTLKKMIKNEGYEELDKWRHIQYVMRKLHKKSKVELIVHYWENRPTTNGCMIYANHQGLYDPIAIAATSCIPFGAVCKEELRKIPIIKDIITATKSFYIDRSSIKQSLNVFNSVADEVKNGRNYIIFPEGTRSKDGNTMGEFHAAAFKCALKSKCDIYPVALVDSYKAFDQKGSGKVTVHINYLPCIKYSEYKDMNSTALSELVKSRIQATLDIYNK